jgi:hypothetical protein
LNLLGRLGYRLEKSLSYGGAGAGDTYAHRKYAAVLRLDPGHRYEYESDRLPDNSLYGHPLNYWARRGYNLVETFAETQCPPEKIGYDPNEPDTPPWMKMIETRKTNVFLFMRRDGAAAQTREYKLLTGHLGWGSSFEELQAALDAAPPGFRPVRLLFSKLDWSFTIFSVSVVVESDLSETDPAKVTYRVVREGKNFEKEVNKLAAGGESYVVGGRIYIMGGDSVKLAVLARRAPGAGAYTFLDDEKHAKEFDRLVAAGHSYQGLMSGDLPCDAYEVAGQKLVFARDASGASRQYKILSLPEPKKGRPPAPALSELQRLAGENFQVRDIFYDRELHVIMEK